MAQQVGELTALAKDRGSVPDTRTASHNHLSLKFLGPNTVLWVLAPTKYIYILIQTHKYMNK